MMSRISSINQQYHDLLLSLLNQSDHETVDGRTSKQTSWWPERSPNFLQSGLWFHISQLFHRISTPSTINCFILGCFLFYKHIYILMIWSTWSKVARKTPSVHSWKTSRSSVFFKSLLVECVDGLSLPNNNCKHGAAQNSTRCWVDVWQPQPRTFGNREA